MILPIPKDTLVIISIYLFNAFCSFSAFICGTYNEYVSGALQLTDGVPVQSCTPPYLYGFTGPDIYIKRERERERERERTERERERERERELRGGE